MDPSSRTSLVKTAPTLLALVMHHQPSSSSRPDRYEDDVKEKRSSFDMDDMRETEAQSTSIDLSHRLDSEPSFPPYNATDSYANTVTSPQSNVRSTSLRRPGSKLNSVHLSGRSDSGRCVNDSAGSYTDRYESEAPRQTYGSVISNQTILESGGHTLRRYPSLVH